MTIDQTYAVDTALAEVDVATLMTKAFELTHRMHAENDACADSGEHERHVERRDSLREQRDAIVREMQRRSDGMERALIRVEAAERVMRNVDATLGAADPTTAVLDVEDVKGRITYCRSALNDMMHETTVVTCTLVKSQALSDRISRAARDLVKPIKEAAREVGKFGARLND